MNTRVIPLLVLTVSLAFAKLGPLCSHAEGITVGQVVVVNEYDDPILAKIHLAKTYGDFGVIVNVGTGDGKKERLTKKSIREVIPVPDLKSDFLHPQQFTAVGDTLNRLAKLLETYPQFREVLLPLGTELKLIWDSGTQGLVREGGSWRPEAPMTPSPPQVAATTIRDNSGREFRQARIKTVDPDGLLVSHEGGVTKVPFVDLPKEIQERYGYDPEKAVAFREARGMIPASPPSSPPASMPTSPGGSPGGGVTPAPVAAPGPAWMPASAEEVADCSLFVRVTNGIDEDGNQTSWNATGFLCNVNGVTYVYSNAHNFDGAREFQIFDQTGKEYSGFVSVEIADEGQAHWVDARRGGDVVRLRLPTFEPKALTLDARPVDESFVDRRILITGNTKGRGEITKLDGAINGVEPNRIIVHNAATQGGNSGSPIVDLETWTVIGILTWGGYDDENPLLRLWRRQSEEVREGINRGAGLAGIRFVPTSFEILYRQRLVMAMLRRNTRLLGLLDALVPTKQGLFVDRDKIVMGDRTVDDLLNESPDHVVVRELSDLDELLLEKAESNIGISNHDMLKLYVSTYEDCLRALAEHRRSIESSDSATFYMKCNIDHARLLDISRAYEGVLADSLNWYRRQLGTRGDALPLGERIRLPQMDSGLEGLGIEE
jgi:hypothetical protein